MASNSAKLLAFAPLEMVPPMLDFLALRASPPEIDLKSRFLYPTLTVIHLTGVSSLMWARISVLGSETALLSFSRQMRLEPSWRIESKRRPLVVDSLSTTSMAAFLSILLSFSRHVLRLSALFWPSPSEITIEFSFESNEGKPLTLLISF